MAAYPYPYVSACTIPSATYSNIPTLGGTGAKDVFGSWHKVVLSVIKAQGLFCHIADPPEPGVLYDPCSYPTYCPADVHPWFLSPANIAAYNIWWDNDGQVYQLLVTTLCSSYAASLPCDNCLTAREVYEFILKEWGFCDYVRCQILLDELMEVWCQPGNIIGYCDKFRVSINTLCQSCFPDLHVRQLLLHFLNHLPPHQFANICHNIIPHLKNYLGKDNFLILFQEVKYIKTLALQDRSCQVSTKSLQSSPPNTNASSASCHAAKPAASSGSLASVVCSYKHCRHSGHTYEHCHRWVADECCNRIADASSATTAPVQQQASSALHSLQPAKPAASGSSSHKSQLHAHFASAPSNSGDDSQTKGKSLSPPFKASFSATTIHSQTEDPLDDDIYAEIVSPAVDGEAFAAIAFADYSPPVLCRLSLCLPIIPSCVSALTCIPRVILVGILVYHAYGALWLHWRLLLRVLLCALMTRFTTHVAVF